MWTQRDARGPVGAGRVDVVSRVAPLSPGLPSTVTTTVADVPPSGRWTWLLRLAVTVGVLVGLVQLVHTPMERSLDDLFDALARGEVTRVTIEQPGPGTVTGQFEVRWDGGLRPTYAFYDYSTTTDLGGPVDESRRILEAVQHSPAEVDVVRETERPATSGVQLNPGGLAWLAALLLLVSGRQPRLATKWAWFWFFLHVPVAALVFVLLEPTPLWRAATMPARPRLTGGWAFVLSLVVAMVLTTFVPGYRELFPV